MFANLAQLWRYRGLVAALVSRNLAARYRGSFLGFMWSMLNPLLFMLVYTLVFRFYIRFGEVEHYSLFLFCGLLPWIWFSSGLTEGTNSLVQSGHLITKSMFPPQILPVVSGLATLVNFVLSLPLLFGFMWAAGVPVPATAALLPVLAAVQLFLILGLSLLLSALNVHYRDVQHLLSNVLTLLFFLCPIIYPASVVPDELRFTILWNPLALLTSFYHLVLLDGALPSASAVVYLLSITAAVFLTGNMVFNRYREEFAELL